MPITINGSGTITGLSAGGLPDGSVTAADLANPLTSATITTATVTTLNAASGVLATQNGMTGIAKAWVVFNGNTATIRGAYNVSSITKNGVGDYYVNFTTAMANVNYSAVVSLTGIGSANSAYNAAMVFARSVATNTTPDLTGFACCAFHPPNGVNQDVNYYCVSVFGA